MTEAQKAEATATTVDFEFRGDTYTAHPLNLTWETLEQDAAGNYTAACRDVLGEEQWAAFTSRHPHPLELDDDGELFNVAFALRAEVMAALGNLGASSGS
jgi:hypothetical protein